MENEKKVGLVGKFKQADESVKLAVVVAAGVGVGVVGTLALQAYGKKRENDALRLRAPVVGDAQPQPQRNVTILRLPAHGQN